MASKNVALGRGLGALFRGEEPSTLEEQSYAVGRIFDVSIDVIRPNPYQPRQDFDENALSDLAESIKQLGIIQPITIRALGGGHYETISGERRLRAARRLGLRSIPAYVREADTEAMLEMALVENVQREELNPVEIALGYQRLVTECGLRQEQVAARVGKTRSTVANFLRLLRLPPRIQALQLKEFEDHLRKRFSTKVRLRHKADGKGTIELHYFSADDLERVLELLLHSL